MSAETAIAAIGNCPRRPQTRPTKEISWELANHAKAYLEARHYANGYAFLHSLLAPGASISVPAKPYIGFVAPAAQLALASTLIAYPPTTTRTTSADYHKGSDAALKYLRCVYSTIEGPAWAKVRKAFSFPDERTRRRTPSARSRANSASPGASGDVERIDGSAANAQSIWQRAEDFWHLVGRAFNCSVAHKRRWARWKLWLEVMLDFLEADWMACVAANRDNSAMGDFELRHSLLWQYISSQTPTSRNVRRRIVRAVFATAAPESLRQYPEVWDNETAEPDLHSPDDYGNDEAGAGTRDAQQRKWERKALPVSVLEPSDHSPISTLDEAVESLGGMEALQLRQRLLALLAQAAKALPAHFTSLEDFFDTVTEELKPLPTIVLGAVISTSRLPGLSWLVLNVNLLLMLTTPQLPDYSRIAPHQSHLETNLLPLRSNAQSFAANAKISLIVEHIFIYMMDEKLLNATEQLREATESGIKARGNCLGSGKTKKGNIAEEQLGKELMEASSERILGLLEVLEVAAGKEPRLRSPTGQLS